ncbi:hypothetical protein PIB30_013665 [Stylosanthes scabra]|uniref:4-coumarate--CoA ligase n=1 Tax=Stylosanthes scabra TaxID=79078 RepID=A0ABU6V8V7_9FABA|nr:hypothetical protein [Stylosanthes scabra]
MEDKTITSFDPKSGFNRATRTFHSLKPPLHLPPPNATISAPSYILSLRRNSPWSDSVTALIDSATGRHLSYAEFIHRSETLASNLASLFALSKYDTALILSPNLLHVPILHFALLSLGVVVSPTNPLATRSELTRIIRLSKPTIAFATSAVVNKLPDEFRHGTVLIDSPEFESLITASRPGAKPERVEVSQSDVAAILYSSGTTGKVKGVMLTHRNLTAMAGAYDVFRAQREKPAVFLYTMPFFHVFGFTLSLRAVVLLETVVLMERFGLRRAVEAIERFRVTHIAGVPSMLVAMIKDDVTAAYDLSSLECVACGGAPLGKDTAAAFKSKFPKVLVLQGYGLTESTAGVARTSNPEETSRCSTTGKLMPGVEAKIVNPHTGQPMFPAEQGELWLRGPSIMKGYVGDPEATSATLVDGWLKTGDLCYFDHDGFLYVLDRFKDLIKYKGYQVAPAELEELLHSHLEINDAAVIPYPDEEAGQVPMAFVVRKPQSSLHEAEIIDFVAKQVAPYKKIRRVIFVDSIPKNAAGKILRKDLNTIALERSISRL